jgi:hypothetical protein
MRSPSSLIVQNAVIKSFVFRNFAHLSRRYINPATCSVLTSVSIHDLIIHLQHTQKWPPVNSWWSSSCSVSSLPCQQQQRWDPTFSACLSIINVRGLFCKNSQSQEKSSKELRAGRGCYWSGMAPICNRFCRPGDQVVGISTTVHGIPCLVGRVSYCCPRRRWSLASPAAL